MKEVPAIGIHFEKPYLFDLSLKRGTLILVGSLVALACSSVAAPPLASETPRSDSSGACSDSEVIPVLGSDRTITRGEYIQTTEALLRVSDPFVGGKSFKGVMGNLGYTIGPLEQNCPGVTFEAGSQSNKDGSIRRKRPVPPSSSAHDVHLPQFNVDWDWWYRSYGLLPVTDTKTGETTYFSLAEPWEPAKGTKWPTFIREGDEYPHPFRRYTQPVYPFPTSDSRQLYPTYTKFSDEAFDLGRGKIPNSEGYLRVGK